MCCQISTLLLCCIMILFARNEILSSAYCPCTWNSSTLAADCTYKWLPSSKRLTKVPPTDCVPATTRILVLTWNNITYRPGQFQTFTELRRLDLSRNRYFTPGNDSFSGLEQLEDLILDETDLRNFRHSLFTEQSNLKTLSLCGIKLDFLTAKLFDNLQHLEILNLMGAFITDTSNSPFAALHSLRDLSLKWNADIILTNQSFTGLTRLIRLDLSFCGLTNLTQDLFDELSNLSELDLSQNRLSEIRDNQFTSLQKLLYLDLSYMSDLYGDSRVQLHPLSFAGLSELKYLNLKHAMITNDTSFPNDVFEPLYESEELHLVRFCIDLESYHYHRENISENLSKLSTLKKLYVDNFVVSSLDAGFSALVNLEELKFYSRYAGKFQIDTFDRSIFENLRNSPISKLTMDDYETEHISPFTFSYFRNLTSLNLTNLELSDWCKAGGYVVDTGLEDTNITHLRLQLRCQGSEKNPLASLVGVDETPLETLDLSYGSITGIEFFHDLPVSLKYIYLHGNAIIFVNFISLHRLKNLVILDISDQIHVSQHSANHTPGNLKQDNERSIKNNVTDIARTNDDIAAIEYSMVYVPYPQEANQDCYKLPLSVTTINIQNSKLFCDLEDVLCDPDNGLKTLNIADQYLSDSRCAISDIWGLLKNLQKLENLNMNSNNIKAIPSGSFAPLRSLKYLHLKHNYLALLEFDLQTFALEALDVSYNNVLYISTVFCDKLDEIAERTSLVVYLNNNSFLCDCERLEFMDWLRGSSAIYQREKLTCQDDSKKEYSFSEIGKLHETLKYKCTVKEVTLGCAATFVMLHLILGILYAIWHRRWKIKYLLAVGRKTVYPFHPIEDCQIELEYDVYISYERDYDVTRDLSLHELVANVIYPALQRRGYRVVIRVELEPGVGLYHSISHTLRRCKKVVALVTRDYCRDYWNVFEFNIAVLEGIYTKRQVMIPVAFEQIGRDDVHDEIFAFLRAGEIGHHTANVTDEMLVDYLSDKIRDNREFGE